jgi:hypothetical protein
MFQRYEIVIDYEQRLRLPPPLTIISYLIMVFEWLIKSLNNFFQQNKNKISQYNFNKKRKSLVLEEDDTTSTLSPPPPPLTSSQLKRNDHTLIGTLINPKQMTSSKKHFDHSNYWKIVAQDFAKKLDDSAREKDIHKEQAIGLFRLREDFQVHKKNIKRLDDRMVSIERNLTAIQVTVEYLKHFLTNKDSLSYLKSLNVNQHIHSRQSPYPFTSLSRFPVFDKYVSWDNLYDSYDPPMITVDKNTYFNSDELLFIDPDELK